MPRRLPLAFLAALACASCGVVPVTVPDTARLPPGQLGTFADPDVTAINLAQYSFADAGRLYGRPIDAARACAALDYIAGQLNTSPRWSNIPAITQQLLLQARVEMRQALGVAPGASSQAVVDHLTFAANALAANDEPAALQLLGPPVFADTAPSVLARLSNLPYLRTANVATMRAANEMFSPDDSDWH